MLDRVGGLNEIPREVPLRLYQEPNSLPSVSGWTAYPLYETCQDADSEPNGILFKVAFAVERLMVLVAGVPSSHCHKVIGTGTHIATWPELEIKHHHWFFSMRTEDASIDEALRNFSDLLAMAHSGRMG